ncbi:conserved exported hypothetical protein [Massilia sp. 9I]|nr:conserved exported hypothetical protein [Massilia sp. 9I]
MKTRKLAIVAATTLASLAAVAAQQAWDGTYSPYTVHYLMYSGTLSEKQAPTRTDKRLSFAVQGQLAKEMFDAIGPDLKLGCGTTLGMRQRERGDVACSFDKDDVKSPYTCHFGIDLRKGKSIEGATC